MGGAVDVAAAGRKVAANKLARHVTGSGVEQDYSGPGDEGGCRATARDGMGTAAAAAVASGPGRGREADGSGVAGFAVERDSLWRQRTCGRREHGHSRPWVCRAGMSYFDIPSAVRSFVPFDSFGKNNVCFEWTLGWHLRRGDQRGEGGKRQKKDGDAREYGGSGMH